MTHDARNGGLPLAVTDEHADGGKRELLVILRAKLGDGRYLDSLDELSTSTSYTVTHDHQTEDSSTLSAEASAGMKASGDGLGALGRKAVPALASRLDDLGDKADDLLDRLPGPLRSQADSYKDSAKDELDDKLGDKLSPSLAAEASRRTAARRGGGETTTVNTSRTGPAHRFVYDMHLSVEVHPWAHDGYYKNAAKSLFVPQGARHDVVKGVWHAPEGVIPAATRLTVHDEDYASSGQDTAARELKPVRNASWKGLPDDAFVDVRPFPATGLHERVSQLVDAGVHVGDEDDVVNSFRAANLYTGTSSTQLRTHFREGLGLSGYRVEVNSKSLRAVTIKYDLGGLSVVRPLRSSTVDQTVAHPTQDHTESSSHGGASASLSSDGPKIEYEGEREGQHDAPAPAAPEPETRKTLYLVRGRIATSVTPEFRDARRNQAVGKDVYKMDGDVWMVADAAGLRAFGLEVPAEPEPEDEPTVVTVQPATPITQSPVEQSPLSQSPTVQSPTQSPSSSQPGSPVAPNRPLPSSGPDTSAGGGSTVAAPTPSVRQRAAGNRANPKSTQHTPSQPAGLPGF
jgi:hypothetical protein